MRATNTDDPSYISKKPEKCLETADKDKNRKYLDACLKHCWHFTAFFASVDGLLGVKAEATLKCITIHLTTKWKDPY